MEKDAEQPNYKELFYQKELQNQSLLRHIEKLQEEVELLNDKLKKLLQERYGATTEKNKDGPNPNSDEPSFFDEPEVPDGTDPDGDGDGDPEEFTSVAAHKRKKKTRGPLPKHLPREEIIHDLEEHEKVCSCGYELHCIGGEHSEKLEFTPATIKVLEHIRLKYACKACEEGVKTAVV
jgi:hypothetical protein